MISGLTLIPSRGGVFEVIINDQLVFSKKELKRHAEIGELEAILEKLVGPDVPKYE